MAKNKKTRKNSNYKKMEEKYQKFSSIDLLSSEGQKFTLNMPLKEKMEFMCFKLAKLITLIANDVGSNLNERISILDAASEIEPMQVVNLLVIKTAIKATTTAQVLEIIQNINSYRVTPFIDTHYKLGEFWSKDTEINLTALFLNYAPENYEDIGKILCNDGVAILTPYGVLWNIEGREE